MMINTPLERILVGTARGCQIIASALLLLLNSAAVARTFKPTSGDQVLETLPTVVSPALPSEIASLRQRAQSTPNDVDAAVALARRLIDMGRATGDPRQYGQAQAAIAAWWDLAEPPPAVRLLRATIRQYNHDFQPALADLEVYLKGNPDDATARLMQATVFQS